MAAYGFNILTFEILFKVPDMLSCANFDTGQENKAQIRVAPLQRAVKIMHHITKYGEILFLMQHIQ